MLLLLCLSISVFFFFFKQKTAYEMRISDWSSDVCSSDLVRDNLNETAPAKATAAGGYFVATGVNAIAQRIADGNTDTNTGTTTSTTYTDLTAAAIGPTITVETGPMALVIVAGQMSNSGTGSARMAYNVSGATTIAAADNRGIGIAGTAGTIITTGTQVLHFGGLYLTPGANTFPSTYPVSAGTGTFLSRRIALLPP